MQFSFCLFWKTLGFISLAVLLTDITEIAAFVSPSDGKAIGDMDDSLKVHSGVCCNDDAVHVFWLWSLPQLCTIHIATQANMYGLKVCKQLPPCPFPAAPRNGGLVCVTIDNAQYCKPMCNKGYDFQFLRRSRLYEVCGNVTGFSWTTQLVGGKALAVCNPSEMAISGAKSAYFPTNTTCLSTLAFTETQKEQINIFLKELGEQGIDGSNRDEEADCIICGY